MPQLRQNIITGDWVVIAPERAKRPHDFIVKAAAEPQDPTSCPFCPHSEAYQTRLTDADTAQAYVIPNKFPAFSGLGEHEVRSYIPTEGFYLAKPAVGGHEVVVVKEHQAQLGQFPQETMVDLLTTIQRRYQYYREDPHIEYVMAFYNHNEAAAASISHPHAQLAATSIIPNHILREKHGSERYYEINGRCVYCEMIEHERQEGVRWLAENDDFVMFTFFASRFPFETWILPKQHHSLYESTTPSMMANLAAILRHGLQLLDKTLHDPALNFFIHSLPTTSEGADYFHWHLEIAPRVAKYGGFELGGGTIIDVVSPEQAAEFLRSSDNQL